MVKGEETFFFNDVSEVMAMTNANYFEELYSQFITTGSHQKSDYFGLLVKLVAERNKEAGVWQEKIDEVYSLILDEILTNSNPPTNQMKFGTSGWRGILGKDVNIRSVSFVTAAIVELYLGCENDEELKKELGVASVADARKRGCVVGFDNRFGGNVLGKAVVDVLTGNGFTVHYTGESTTGVLSAALLELGAAFSINLTPSHNPMQYGGFKYNAADGGPAQAELTSRITRNGRRIIGENRSELVSFEEYGAIESNPLVQPFDSLELWKSLVRKNTNTHGIDLDRVIDGFEQQSDMVIVIDSVHGASRLHVSALFNDSTNDKLIHLRSNDDKTFGGIAPEPSAVNMTGVVDTLAERTERLKLGAIIDPDGDRIRFTDGETEISMNQFGAMAYHFIHEIKGKQGMVAKTVATSNLANQLADQFNEELFEPRVGFKEFKPVMGKALVFFEESDGISIIGHTPEKDAYIGLMLAIDMMLTLDKTLGAYLKDIEEKYGAFYPDRDGIEVSLKGEQLTSALAALEKYGVGASVTVGETDKIISELITIDGRKMIFEDGSWLMIRPSGTEPKVRFYVEARTDTGKAELVQTAKGMLKEIGVIT